MLSAAFCLANHGTEHEHLPLYQNRLKQGIEVILLDDPMDVILLANSEELAQVWVNLIDNAIYAVAETGTLNIVVTQFQGWAWVKVTCSGSGMPSRLLPKVLEPFFTTKPQGEGSGLGLDIVRQIVERYWGEIGVDSQPGRTTFTVGFPATD